MTTDKLFVLLLVILLPLTGCLDIADTAEAEESDDDYTTTTMPLVHSLLIPADSNHTITFTGDSTLKLEQAYSGERDPDCGGGDDGNNDHCPITWMPINYIQMEMICDSFSMDSYLSRTYFIPALGDETCVVVFTPGDYDVLAHFSEVSLSAL